MNERIEDVMNHVKTVMMFLAALGVLLSTSPLYAHHAFASEFDPHSAVTLKGKITRVEWMNPHIYFYMDTKDDSGRPVHYAVQAAAPNTLSKLGWTSTSLKPGDLVTVVGFKSRDGWNRLSARDVTMPDGRRVLVGLADPIQQN
jgi:hypothetical protein